MNEITFVEGFGISVLILFVIMGFVLIHYFLTKGIDGKGNKDGKI